MMVFNVWAMFFVARRGQRRQQGKDLPGGYIQFISAYLPYKWKVWFVVSTLAGAVAAIEFSFRGVS
jgi:hypothetical protein